MELKVSTRTIFGKKTKSLREAGQLPAEIYGNGVPNQHFCVSEKDFNKLYKTAGSHTVVNVLTDDGKKVPVIISEVQRDALSGKVLNIDLHQIRMDEKIQTKVPIEFTGTPLAEKAGLLVVKVMDEIEIESLPGKIPASFVIDIEKMEKIGDSIHISDVMVSEGVKVLLPEDSVIVTVTERAKEEVVTPSPVVVAEGAETTVAVAAEPKAEAEAKKEAQKK